MLMNAQPRVVSHFRTFTPQRTGYSTRHLRKSEIHEMANNLNSMSASDLSGTNEGGWVWNLDGLDEGGYSDCFPSGVYGENIDTDVHSYYGQQRSVNMASSNNATAYACHQPQQYYYARNTYNSAPSMDSQQYTSTEYCRPSALHSQIGDDIKPNMNVVDSTQDCFFEPAYAMNMGINYWTSISPVYLTTGSQQTLGYALPKSSWYNTEASFGSGTSISPATSGSGISSALAQTWNHSLDSSPSSAVSPADRSLSYQSYSSSELSFSDSESEDHTTDGNEGPEEHMVRSVATDADYRIAYADKKQRNSQLKYEGEICEKVYIPIAPTPSSRKSRSHSSQRDSCISSGTSPTELSSIPWAGRNKPYSMTRDDEKDAFLIRSKRAGMSYKDIRRLGRFKEAESTLRGRYRTLTKSKEERVRRPNWTDKDLRLLMEGVLRFGGAKSEKDGRDGNVGSGMSYGKVKWMQVAAYIKENGGSYHFGNATCRKKWDEVVAGERR